MHPLSILVVGGNGFIGSAVCKAALARGIRVTSISTSGRPFQTAKGHTPPWTQNVDWHAADALRPSSYAHLLPGTHGVVHTLGTLLDDARYKSALGVGDLPALATRLLGAALPGAGNPLNSGYDLLNRDSALAVCEAFLASSPPPGSAFVYISAEDIFRPFVSPRYITTKREAELRIAHMLASSSSNGCRGVYIRPSVVYHAHHRPLTAPLAALLDLSVTLHAKAPSGAPTPSSVLRALGSAFSESHTPSSSESQQQQQQQQTLPSALDSIANALTIPPIHVDHVAQAICVALDPERDDVRGVVDVHRMRELIGWRHASPSQAHDLSSAKTRS